MITKFVGILFVASLAGCATVLDPNGASSEYTCTDPNNPDEMVDGIVCKTPFAVYKSTHGAPEVKQSDLPIGVTMEDYQSGNIQVGGNANPNEGMPHPAFGLGYQVPGQLAHQNQPDYARPVREPAQIMRIWIAPWIDKRDDLHFPSHVYTEIQARHWAFGVEAFHGRGVIMPTKELGAVPGGRVMPKGAAKPVASSQVGSSQQRVPLDTGTQLPDLPTK